VLRLLSMVLLVTALAIPAAMAAEPVGNDGAATAPEEQPVVQEKPMTQAELAVIIVRMLGLESEIDANIGGKSTFSFRSDISPIVYIDFLRRMGIHPLPDWDPNAEVTKEALAVVLIQLLGLVGEVQNRSLPSDYILVCETHDIILTNVRQVLSEIEVINPVVQIPIGGLFQENLSTIRGR
jgi:hypothetical protein